jgi:hypothetical protein
MILPYNNNNKNKNDDDYVPEYATFEKVLDALEFIIGQAVLLEEEKEEHTTTTSRKIKPTPPENKADDDDDGTVVKTTMTTSQPSPEESPMHEGPHTYSNVGRLPQTTDHEKDPKNNNKKKKKRNKNHHNGRQRIHFVGKCCPSSHDTSPSC